MKQRLAAAVILATIATALAGCEPYFVSPDPTRASISIGVGSTGGADAQLVVGGRTQTRAELVHIGQSVAAALFPNSAHRSVGIGHNPGGYPLVHIHAAGVYKPEAHPVVTIDTGPAVGVLHSLGVSNVHVEMRGPGVPAVANWTGPPPSYATRDIWSWPDVARNTAAPAGTIALSPRPSRGFGDLILAVLCLASLYPAIVGMRRRRRLLSGTAAVVASAAAIIDILSAGGAQPNNLGVAGLVNGLELNIVKALTFLPFAAATAAVCLFIVTAVRVESRTDVFGSFNAPPGWPTPPAGWSPVLGWQPDPSWPPPPPDWVFWREPDSQGSNTPPPTT